MVVLDPCTRLGRHCCLIATLCSILLTKGSSAWMLPTHPKLPSLHPSRAWSRTVGSLSRIPLLLQAKNNAQRQKQFLNDMQEPMKTTVGDGSTKIDDETRALVHCIVRAADGRKAENIVALTVSHVTTVSEVLVILSGNSRPQNQAIATAILDDVNEQFGYKPGSTGVPEGRAESGWMLLDYGSVIVHIMTARSRLYYDVEGQWRDKGGIYWDLSNLLIPNSAVNDENEKTKSSLSQQDDPFWS